MLEVYAEKSIRYLALHRLNRMRYNTIIFSLLFTTGILQQSVYSARMSDPSGDANKFAVNLYDSVAKSADAVENAANSPFSAEVAQAMMYSGKRHICLLCNQIRTC